MTGADAPILALRGIHQRFAALHVLRGVTLDLHRGETLGLIGPNGAGKTSLLNVISGFARPDAGRIMLTGRDIGRLGPQARARLGLVRCFQSSHIFPEHSVRDNLVLALRAGIRGQDDAHEPQSLTRSRAQADALLGQTPLRDRAHACAHDLSYGQRRLLDLLIALAPQPSLLLLDEPTAGLSSAEATQAMQLVQDICPDSTVLLVSHDLDIVFAHCDRIAVLNQGALVATGSVDAIRRDAVAQKAYLGEVGPEPIQSEASHSARQDTEHAHPNAVANAPVSDGVRAHLSPATRLPSTNDSVALQVDHLNAGYGGADVISGISFSVRTGECVAILGRNGAGKTTLLHSLFNIGPQRDGCIRLHGQRVDTWPGHRIARAGMALVPQGRGVFPNLSVRQSLGLAQHSARHAPAGASFTRDDVFKLWPRLAERQHTLCANLSGGERQLLALARALLTRARLIVLDEPSEGLAPRIIADTLQPALYALRAQGHTLLLAEQNIQLALALATRVLVLADHRLVFDGTPQQLQAQPDILQRHLGLA